MIVEKFNAFCASLPCSTHVVQWGGAHVWKVGGKVFAIGGAKEGKSLFVSFKCSELTFEILKEQPGVRPAPYLASRGMIWLQRTSPQTMSDAALKDALHESHRLVSLGLPKTVQKRLGLNQTSEVLSDTKKRAPLRSKAKPPREKQT